MSSCGYFWVLHNTLTRWLWLDLARLVQARTGLMPVLMVPTAQDRRYYEAQNGGPLDFPVEVMADPYETVLGFGASPTSAETVTSAARNLEERFRIGLFRDYVLADRHMGRGYMVAGTGHPTSPVARAARHESVLAATVSQFEWTERMFERYPPEMVLSYYGGAGPRQKPFAVLCRSKGVPFRAICPSRFGSLLYWADDEFEGSRALRRCLRAPYPQLSPSEIEETVADLRPSSLSTNPAALARRRKSTRWRHIARQAAYIIAQRAYGHMRRYSFARRGYDLSSTLSWLLRNRRHWKQLDRIASRSLPNLPGRKVVYFPLQQEPEASTLALAPRHTNQFATVLELSLAIPADAVLIVKEHIWQVGRRPDWFYDALLRFPNVILMHHEASSLEIIHRADVVATITSSAGYEAAVLGKHTIFFWDRSPILSVPHVHDMTRFDGLERIDALLRDDSPEAVARRRHDGARLLRQFRDFCIDGSQLNFFGRSTPLEQAHLEQLVRPLLDEIAAIAETRHSDRPPAHAQGAGS